MSRPDPLQLRDGSRAAIIGGGPAGSLCASFLLRAARRAGLALHVDVYEPRDFSRPGPRGCNMCGGIVSDVLTAALAAEGIALPPSLLQHPIAAYVLMTAHGGVRIEMPTRDRRIGALYRGRGPLFAAGGGAGLDGHLLAQAVSAGARHIPSRVSALSLEGGRPVVETALRRERYDLLVGATGVNSTAWRMFKNLGLPPGPARTARAYIAELPSSVAGAGCLQGAMYIFLLGIPGLKFAAIIPKQEMLTVCLLGDHIDQPLVEAFFASEAVRRTLPGCTAFPQLLCRCAPLINVGPAARPFADRVVLVGDCGVTRLYKDGIGAAYRTSRAAAETAVHCGVSAGAFRRSYLPVYRAIARDNRYGQLLFFGARRFQAIPPLLRGLLALAAWEQDGSRSQRLSAVLWDLFTGSAPYGDILIRAFDLRLLARLTWATFRAPSPG